MAYSKKADVVRFSQTADVTVANTVTKTTLIGSGVGSVTFPANFFSAGSTLRVRNRGYHSSTGNPNITINAELSGSEICTTGANTSGNGSSNGYLVDVLITFRTIGASGTVVASGIYKELHSSGIEAPLIKNTTTTVDTTAALTLSINLTWGTAAAGNTLTSQVTTVEVSQ